MPPSRVVSRRGVTARRALIDDDGVALIEGLRVTAGPRTLRDLAANWSLLDLVVMADAALRFGDCDAESLVEAARTWVGRGSRTLRRAVALADARSESAMETLLRLVIVIPGLPRPVPQAVVRDDCGGWLARVDLLGADGRSVFEYDGVSHEGEARHASDVSRWRMLHRRGFKVFPYTKRDIYHGASQILSDYQGALGLPDDPRAAEAWLRE